MALNNKKAPVRPDPAASMSQRRRWIVFGTNVVVALLLATIVGVAAVWLSGTLLKGKARSDWTSTGRFSLSPRTKAILGDLKTDVQLTLLYPDPSQYGYKSEEAYRRAVAEYERLKDLTQEYTLATRHITSDVVDPLNLAEADALMERLHKKFESEFSRKEELLKDFEPFRTTLDEFIAKELGQITAIDNTTPPLPQDIEDRLGAAMGQLIGLSKQIKAQVEAELMSQKMGVSLTPAQEKATLQEARALTTLVADNFQEFPAFYGRLLKLIQPAQGEPLKVPAELVTFLKTAPERYEPIRKAAEALKGKFLNISSLKFEQIEKAITDHDRGLLIETETDAVFLPTTDLWVSKQTAGGEEEESGGQRLFVGESAVTSALASLVQPEKPAVIFVTFGSPATGYGGQFYDLGEQLRKANFIVEDWDLARSPQMPRPEHMTTAILVLTPPPPPSQRQPLPASAENYKPAIDAVAAGTPAILICEPGGMFSPTVPFEGLYELFGTKPDFRAIAVQSRVVDSGTGAEQALPEVNLIAFPDTVITRPLNGLPTVFAQACPLIVAKTPPEGVTDQTIVELPAGSDFWADTNFMDVQNGTAKFNPAEDRLGPLPLGVAATRTLKDGVVQRAVLFGGHFAEGASPRYRNRCPGNAELFLNSVLWVSGAENLIATSAEALQARRLSGMGSWETPLKVILIGGLPAVVLLAGILVFLARRR